MASPGSSFNVFLLFVSSTLSYAEYMSLDFHGPFLAFYKQQTLPFFQDLHVRWSAVQVRFTPKHLTTESSRAT